MGGEEEEGAVSLEIPTEESVPERLELKRERLRNEGEESPSKKQAKEPSNDDIVSEISNPVSSSPVENTSRFRGVVVVSTHPVKSGSGDSPVVECNEEFGSEETVSDEEERSGNVVAGSPPPTTTTKAEQFVLEIPKHLSSTGVTRITFKLSKQKDVPVVVKDHHAWDDDDEKLLLLPKKKKKKVVASSSSGGFPSNVKKLLATGMLDGAPVKYISLPRVVKSQTLFLLVYIFVSDL